MAGVGWLAAPGRSLPPATGRQPEVQVRRVLAMEPPAELVGLKTPHRAVTNKITRWGLELGCRMLYADVFGDKAALGVCLHQPLLGRLRHARVHADLPG